MIRTVRADEKQERTRYMIVGRLSEIGQAHIVVGGTRAVLPAELPGMGLTTGEIVTVSAGRDDGHYVVETVARLCGPGSRMVDCPESPVVPSHRHTARTKDATGALHRSRLRKCSIG